MHAMTILGSPRRHGNTSLALTWLEEEIEAAGWTVDHVNIQEHRIGHCRESHQCRYPEANACGTADDAASLFERMLAADLVVFASPVFCWGFPAPLKAFLDRLYCLAGYHDGVDSAIRLTGKKIALLSTCGGPADDNADIMEKAFRNMVVFWNASDAGFLLFSGCDDATALGDEAEARARAFAQGLTA